MGEVVRIAEFSNMQSIVIDSFIEYSKISDKMLDLKIKENELLKEKAFILEEDLLHMAHNGDSLVSIMHQQSKQSFKDRDQIDTLKGIYNIEKKKKNWARLVAFIGIAGTSYFGYEFFKDKL